MLVSARGRTTRPVRHGLLATAVAITLFGTPATALTIEQAVRRAAAHAPSLTAARHALRAAGLQQQAASRRADPVLEAAVDDWGGALARERRELTLQLTQLLELGGDRAARRAVAAAGFDQATAAFAQVRRDFAMTVASDFVAGWLAHERSRASARAESLATEASALAAARHREGAGSAAEQLRAESAYALAAADAQRHAAEAEASARALAAHWGAESLDGDSLALPPIQPLGLADTLGWFTTRAGHPEALAAQAATRSASAAQALARAEGRPDLEVGFGLRHLGEVPGTGFVASLGMPLPLGGGRRAYRAAAEALESQARASESATTRQLEVRRQRAAARWNAAWQERQLLLDRALPAAERAAAETLQGYRAGRWSLADVNDARRSRFAAELALLDATARIHEARLELQALTGALDAALTGGTW